MIRQSKQHLAAAGKGDGEHFCFATSVRRLAIAIGLGCLVHARVAARAPRTCSANIARLKTMFAERRRIEQVAQQSPRAFAVFGLLLLAGAVGGALAFAIPLAFLLANRALDGVHAAG